MGSVGVSQPAQQRAAFSANFKADQINLLSDQIVGFKMLSRNMPLPKGIQKKLLHTLQLQNAKKTGLIMDDHDPHQDTKMLDDDSEPPVRHYFDTFTSPYTWLNDGGTISSYDHAWRGLKPVIPSLLPTGVEVERVRHEREQILYSRMEARRHELENLPANVATWDTSKSDFPEPDESTKLKAAIELKKLRLLPKQRALRQSTMRDVLHYDNLAQTANRAFFRRPKRTSLEDARLTRRLESEQRQARDDREKTKQNEQIVAVIKHARDMHKEGLTQKSRIGFVGKMSQTHQVVVEKEEQKRMERTAKQRLQALKNDDEATYLKLLGQAKDSRISHLLKQTDGFLKQLAASVKQQQRNTVEHYGSGNAPDDDISESDDDDGEGEDKEAKVDYYEVAHRVKEEVKAQASILVGGTLKEYQIKGLQWMISLYNNNLNGILADEMGLGKTIQTISLITYLIERKHQSGPFLVVVPLSTLTNWNLEFEKWAPSVKRIVYKGVPQTRRMQQNQIRYGQFQVLLTTYEYIIKDRPVLSKIKWLHLIVDEGHRMKNANSKLSSTLTQYYHTRYRLILTGTPLQNNLPELWALLNFVLPTIFKSVKSFDEWFNTPFANTGGQDRMDLSEEEQLLVIRRLHKVLRPFLLRRLKKDVEKDLPDKQERVIKCKFSALQAKIYKQLVQYQQISVGDGKGGKTGIRGLTNMLMQLRKLCNHPFVFEQVEEQINPRKITDDNIWRVAGKFELLDRVLPKFKATGHRVLMFFQMTQIMNIMEDFLRLRGMDYLRLDGSTKSDDRSELLRLFNAPNSPYFCFLLSTRAGGLGLNLQTADTVIIYDSDWNPHQDLQAQDRAHRIGQKNEVRILRLISSNSVEEKILERARFKLDMDGKVIQAGKFDNKSTVEERENLLRTLMEAAEDVDAFQEQEEMDDNDLNVNMARSEEEVAIFQEIDSQREKDPLYGTGKKLPRLMGESELPDIYLNDENPVQEEEEVYAGRGARERTKVKYDDGLTEEQWLLAVDDDEDTIEAAQARKQARIDKRHTNKERRIRQAAGIDSPPESSRQSSEEPPPKKRGRKSAGAKRKAEEEVEEVPMPKKKRGRAPKVPDTLSPGDRSTIQRIMTRVIAHLNTLEAEAVEELPSDDSDDSDEAPPTKRSVIGAFLQLVSKKEYPDYYRIIEKPMAIENIQKRIDRNEYQSLRQFLADIRTLCGNARIYNEDTSIIFIDAVTLEVREHFSSPLPALLSVCDADFRCSDRTRPWRNCAPKRPPSVQSGRPSRTTPTARPRFPRPCPAR